MTLHKNMVFTSAGDNTHFLNWWPSDSQTYDIYVIYYGDNEAIYNEYKSKVTYIEKSKGSKFQNFYSFYKEHPEIIKRYDYFFIVDDDIQIKAKDINELFKVAKKRNLLICAPSFSTDSKISWPHTRHKSNRIITYVNIIEVNVPLFKRCALDALMKVYDPKLIGWGIDILSMWANGLHKKKAYAILHKIICTNPKDEDKNSNIRELYKIPGALKRETTWIDYADSIGCPRTIAAIEYTSVKKTRRSRSISKLYNGV
jgi:hypothetical protein